MSIVSNIQMLINDQGVFWSNDQLYDAINESQLDVWGDTKWSLSNATLNLNTGDDIVAIPPTLMIPQYVVGTNTSGDEVRIFPSTQRELETYNRLWRGEGVGLPQVFVLWDYNHFRVFPRPDQAYIYTVFGVGYPTEISDITSDIVGPRNYVDTIENYSVANLLEATRPDLSKYYNAQGDLQLDRFNIHLRNFQSHNLRRFRPASKFDLKQSGNVSKILGPNYEY